MLLDLPHIHIRQARERAGLTQAAIAEKLGIGRTSYIAFETGRTKLFSKLVGKMSGFLNISEEELLYGHQPDENLLRDQSTLDEWKRSLVDDYERRLASLQDKLATADRIIASQDLNIRTLSETNQYLLQQLRKSE